jgi:hypothetical protein
VVETGGLENAFASFVLPVFSRIPSTALATAGIFGHLRQRVCNWECNQGFRKPAALTILRCCGRFRQNPRARKTDVARIDKDKQNQAHLSPISAFYSSFLLSAELETTTPYFDSRNVPLQLFSYSDRYSTQ